MERVKITKIEEIPAVPSRCLSVNGRDKLFTMGNSILTHNSVVQRNIINAALLRPEHWMVLGIDLKRVELSMYRQFGVYVATTLTDACSFLRFAQSTMMSRYELLESRGLNNYGALPDEERGPALLIMIDELAEALDKISGKSEEAKEMQEAQEEMVMHLVSIARLGRAARVFLVAATQRPSSDIIPMQLRDNMSSRIGCGRLKSNLSVMLFNSGEGRRIHAEPKGGVGIQIHDGEVNIGQGFFAQEDWLENYFAEHGGFNQSKGVNHLKGIEEVKDASENPAKTNERPESTWDEGMDDIYSAAESTREAMRNDEL